MAAYLFIKQVAGAGKQGNIIACLTQSVAAIEDQQVITIGKRFKQRCVILFIYTKMGSVRVELNPEDNMVTV